MKRFSELTLLRLLPVLGLLLANSSMAADGGRDGVISLYTYYLKERVEVRYRDGDKLLPDGMKRIEALFRSRDSNSTLPIDLRLAELLDRIEDHFQVRQVEVVSGYRSILFNQGLKASGHTVANESFHTKGMAADIHLDEISEEALRDYAQSLGAGGVGYYPSLNMVHVDVGPVRTWGEPAPRKNWVGERNETTPVTLTVAPDRSVGRKRLESLRIDGGTVDPAVEIEYFDRDRWTAVGRIDSRIPLHEQENAFQDLRFGKFRLKAAVREQSGVIQYSNEFYFKRI